MRVGECRAFGRYSRGVIPLHCRGRDTSQTCLRHSDREGEFLRLL